VNWIKENIKLFLSIFGTVTAVGGFIVGVYVTSMTLKTDLENNKYAIQRVEKVLSEQQASYDKMMWFLMNRKHEKIIKAEGVE